MSLGWTLAVLVAGLALVGVGIWSERRQLMPGTLRFPPLLGLGVGFVLVVVAVAHLVTLETGLALPGRGAPQRSGDAAVHELNQGRVTG